MTIGLTNDGLTIRSLDNVKAYYEELMRSSFGEIDTSPSSVMGQLIGVISEPTAELWEQLENVYQSQYPSDANGTSLDNVIQFNGLIRLNKTPSTVYAVLYGTQGTIVPLNTRFSTYETNNTFFTLADVTIDIANVTITKVSIDTVINNHNYTITINSITSTYISSLNASSSEITHGLTTQLNNDNTTITAIDNLDGSITIVSLDLISSFNIVVGAGVIISNFATSVLCEALIKGPLKSPVGTLTVIDTPVFGLDSIDNIIQEVTGRDKELDQDLRLRRLSSLNLAGAATMGAIYSRLTQNVPGVTGVNIIENDKDIVDSDGRPPHCFECTVSGGENEDVAQEIWLSKPAGIQPVGNMSAEHVDSQGVVRVIHFSRPVDLYAHIKVELTLSTEVDFPTNGASLVQSNLYDYGETFSIGQDLIIQKFFTPIFQVPGISIANIYLDVTPVPGATPSYVQVNIPIGTTELAHFDTGRIIIVIL